jgi:hypothetical protein
VLFCYLLHFSERGIYCELNLQKCISYGIPPGSTSRSLKNLRKALLAEGEKDGEGHTLRTGAVQSSVVNTAIAYLHTDTAKRRKSVAIRLLTEFDMIAAVGRISAETVIIDFLDCVPPHSTQLYRISQEYHL